MKAIVSHELLSKYTHSFLFDSFSALSTISESGSLRIEKRSDGFGGWSKKAGQLWAWACHGWPSRELWNNGFCSMLCYCLVACPHSLPHLQPSCYKKMMLNCWLVLIALLISQLVSYILWEVTPESHPFGICHVVWWEGRKGREERWVVHSLHDSLWN